LIHDHDAKYGGGSDRVFAGDGTAVIRTPIAAPRANSHIERQIGSTRCECLDWLLILNRQHLERVLTEWIEHYNQGRPHRGLDLQTPIARSDPGCNLRTGEVRRATRWASARILARAGSGRGMNSSRIQ
jgi:transposase InsO family protein